MEIAVIDYGAGNLKSIVNACRYLGYNPETVSNPNKLKSAEKIILPGVGNFGDAMKKLEKFRGVIIDRINNGIPFLGLCLGIQVIFENSEESPKSKGLSIFKGSCRKFPDNVKVPQIGWNSIEILNKKVPILKRIPSGSYFYFVHSYYPVPENKEIIAATTEYGVEFPAVIANDNVSATQFHPEKSGKSGLKILENFLKL